jgi:hypothetical protein
MPFIQQEDVGLLKHFRSVSRNSELRIMSDWNNIRNKDL